MLSYMANSEIAPGKLEGNNGKNLSDLPDEILGHILSFMETREAVRTSTLSKRWKYVRTLTPSLVFDDRRFWEIKENLWIRVGDYIAREINLRGLVKSFGFEVRHYIIDAAVLRSLITELVMRNVQEVSLLLNTSNDQHNVLPECLFTCKSLLHFKFSIGCIASFQLPSTVRLSNLKTMSLSHVKFLDEHSTNQLFSSCPVLEDLTLKDCRWSNIELVNVCTPKLLRLSISEGDYYGSTNPHGCRIVVSGPNLTEFDYDGDFSNEHYLQSANSLERACIKQTVVTRRDRLYRLLPCLSSVRDLNLELYVNDNEVTKDAERLLDDMPVFKNLLHLGIHGYYDGSPVLDYNIELIKKLLKNSPRLQVLKVIWAVFLEHQILKLPKVSKHCKVIVDC